jgi:hypothetical protein
MKMDVKVCNDGPLAGYETVLVFTSPPQSARLEGAPLRQLATSFTRVFVNAHECVSVPLELSPRDVAFAHADGIVGSVAGEWKVQIGQPAQLTHTFELK